MRIASSLPVGAGDPSRAALPPDIISRLPGLHAGAGAGGTLSDENGGYFWSFGIGDRSIEMGEILIKKNIAMFF